MIDRQQFLVLTRLEIETLEVWIKEEWFDLPAIKWTPD
jgi:hypothetical protein